MMRPTNLIRSVCAAAVIAAWVAGTPVWANRAVQPQVTGQVSAVAGQAAVTINGQTYLIATDSAAYQSIRNVHVGDTIGLILDGPSTSSTTHVIGIVTTASSK